MITVGLLPIDQQHWPRKLENGDQGLLSRRWGEISASSYQTYSAAITVGGFFKISVD